MKNIYILTSILGVSIILILINLTVMDEKINNQCIDTRLYPDIISVDSYVNDQTYLDEYEAAKYLKLSYEAFMSAIYNGEYTGIYITERLNDGSTEYIFPKVSLDDWYMEYAKENKEFKMDSTYFHKD